MMYYNTLLRVMRYCVDTEENVRRKSKSMFRISGRSDSNYAKCPATRRSASGYNIKLEGAVIIYKIGMQKTTTVSVTEAEIVSAVACAQDMTYANKNSEICWFRS